MAKYYVQSGSLRTIVQAESIQKAAVWAVHQVLGQVMPLETVPPTMVQEASASAADPSHAAQRVAVLGSQVRVSEQGFDRSDARTLTTLEVMSQWSELISTLDRLEKMLYRVAA